MIQNPYFQNFLGRSSQWYKLTIAGFLIANPIALWLFGPFFTGWLLIVEFIFTLAMALKCYPLQPGGLLALQAVLLGMTSTETIKAEVFTNFPVILLLMFMVAGIYFMKDLLLFVFTKIILHIHSKIFLSLLFCSLSAIMSAFLDALTVTAVIISVCVGFYSVYHKVASNTHHDHSHDHKDDSKVQETRRQDLEDFRAFLRSLLMHGAVGTALGGVCTSVGEPQNLLIAKLAGWEFADFFFNMAPITLPVFVAGLATCALLEKIKLFDYGHPLNPHVRDILADFDTRESAKRTQKDVAKFIVQALAALVLVVSLALHLAEVGLIGLCVIVLLTAFNGITEESQLGKAFEEALPFTALLVVFFAIVAVIHEQHLFDPIIQLVLNMDDSAQAGMLFIANGVLSMISDNVFVASIYIGQVHDAFVNGAISKEHFDKLAVAINTGTNLPSVATPNGQAAFLFLLTSAIAPLVRLSYGKMIIMALPYTLVTTTVGFLCIHWFL